jgi:hypothetical protein
VRVSHHTPLASTTTKAAAVRAIAAAPLDDGTGSPLISGAGTSVWVKPHLHVASRPGTRR